MKKHFIYLMSLLFLMNFSAEGQNTCLGVKGGISIPNLSAGGSNNNPLNTGYKSRLGPDLALFADFGISTNFSIEPMVEYSSQGGKKDGMQAFPTPDDLALYFQSQGQQAPPYVYANYKSEAKLNYLLIPILAKFGWNFHHSSPWTIYVDAGPLIGFLLSAKQVTSGSSNIYADPQGQQQLSQSPQSFDNTDNIKDQLHSANFGVEGNVGLSYKTGNSILFIEGGANYGFINIQKGTANGDNRTGAGTVTLGYAYCFGKK
jgi:Outer membrane protein beta-barrel domain